VESLKTSGEKKPAASTLESETFIVPFDRNERFTGRKELLRTLKQILSEEVQSDWNHRVALYGMGGVGKTQVAIEYVYANRETYDRIYWITAETEASILSGFQEMAVRTQCLASLSIQNPDDKWVAKFVLSWLRQQKNWLIVFDNLDDITIVKHYLPKRGPDQHTLISTRNPNADGIPARGLEVPLLEVEESIQMLCHLSKMDPVAHRISAKEVVEELQYLPLAIEQAASYVRNVTRDFTIYLADYRPRRSELHGWIPPGNRQYSHSLATAWLVSFGLVEREVPAALKFLQLLSFLNPDHISLDFLAQGKSAFETDMEEILADALKFSEVLLCLERFSLVKWSRERRTLSIHRLVQAVVKDKIQDIHCKRWASVVVKMCDIVMPKELTNDTRKVIREYQGQVVIPLVGLGDDYPPEGAEVVYRIGYFMQEEGKYVDAEKLISIAIRAVSVSPEKDDTRMLQFSSRLGGIKRDRGQLSEAAALLQKTLHVQRVALGPKHSDTLASMNDLALVYWNQGLLSEAAELQKETLRGLRRELGKDHPKTLSSMNNLAIVYWEQGLLSEAAELQKETLAGRMRLLGKDHPDTLSSMNNLAVVYRNQGLLSEAAELYKEALANQIRVLGKDNPDTLRSMNNLAVVYWNHGLLSEAAELYKEALAGRMRLLGKDHPDTLSSMNNLAIVYKEQGLLSEAAELQKETLAGRMRLLGKDHPETLSSMNNLAVVYWTQGLLGEAAELYKETLDRRMRLLGKDHPETLSSMNNLAVVYRAQGLLTAAADLAKEATQLRTEKLGSSHPHTLAAMDTLGLVYRDMPGELSNAIRLFESVLEIGRRTLGDGHLDTIEYAIHLGGAYVDEGRLDKGIKLLENALDALKKLLTSDHYLRFEAMNDLGVAYALQGRLAEAMEIHSIALADAQNVLGPRHPQVLTLLSNLADNFSKQRRWKEAVECQEKAVEGMRCTYGVDHKFTTKGLQKLEELRNSMDSNVASQSQPDLAPPAPLDLIDDKSTNALDLPSSAAEPTTRQSLIVTEQTNDVLTQELIQNFPTVPESEPESRVAVLAS